MKRITEPLILGFPKIMGIYSSDTEVKAGSGATAHITIQTIYWYVRQLTETSFEIQPLNAKHMPSGIISKVDLKEFSSFSPAPGYYKDNSLPVLDTLKQKIIKGEDKFSKGQLDRAELDFLTSLKIDELNVGSSFLQGMEKTGNEDYIKIRFILNVLLELDGESKEEHRRQFNQLGISLRKNGMIDDAIRYYNHALDYDNSDDHLYFNLARTHYAKGDVETCRKYLARCLEINPDLEAARKFMRYLENEMR